MKWLFRAAAFGNFALLLFYVSQFGGRPPDLDRVHGYVYPFTQHGHTIYISGADSFGLWAIVVLQVIFTLGAILYQVAKSSR